MSDAFLVLAQAPGGLTCYLLPRVLPDGERNAFRIDRLKDKLGNRSNASAEIRLEGAWARRVGEEGRGVPTIVEMVNLTRFDCVLGSVGLMRRAVAEATHHAAHRSAFGRPLIEQPLMANVLADLCLDLEAATALALRLGRALDEGDRAFARLGIAIAKYQVCKATPPLVAEALECLGGNGYVEESGLPRLYREAPLNSLWEGAGNVNSLDVMRAAARSPESLEAVLGEIELAAELAGGAADVRAGLVDEAAARRTAERLALLLQASLLLRHGDPAVAELYVATRLRGEGGRAYGTLPPSRDLRAIVERSRPQLAATTPAPTSAAISSSA
jgi:putative acyl-CoA dehydrogenase